MKRVVKKTEEKWNKAGVLKVIEKCMGQGTAGRFGLWQYLDGAVLGLVLGLVLGWY